MFGGRQLGNKCKVRPESSGRPREPALQSVPDAVPEPGRARRIEGFGFDHQVLMLIRTVFPVLDGRSDINVHARDPETQGGVNLEAAGLLGRRRHLHRPGLRSMVFTPPEKQ
jgi:hypothetical protein